MQAELSKETLNSIYKAVKLGVRDGGLEFQKKSIENIPDNIGNTLKNTLDGIVEVLPDLIKSFNEIDKIIDKS
tara:strand:- start:98 stop:316 length:219 start_codon:yes stop_codon:yes gene_type:complete